MNETGVPTYALSDLVEGGQISYGIVQPGNHVINGVPIVRVKDVRNGNVDLREPMMVTPDIAERHSKTKLRGGELLLSLVGTVGETAVATEDLAGWNVARAIAVIRPQGVEAGWLRLAFQMPEIVNRLDSMLNTTVQSTLNLSDLKRLQIPLPEASVREGILDVLGALDDKIAANESLARLHANLADQHFKRVDHGANGPQRNLADLVDTQYGLTASATMGSGPRFLRVTDINKKPWIEWESAPGCLIDDADWMKYRVCPGDILVARMADPGKAAYIDEDSPLAVFASYLVRLKPRNRDLALFIYYFLRSVRYQDYAAGAMSGSVQSNMNARVIVDTEISIPSLTEVMDFNRLVLPIRASMQTVLRENQRLADTRETLLPLLMSGKIRVKDAGKQVEAVV